MPAKSNDLLDKCRRIFLFIFGGLFLPIIVFLGLAHAPALGQANVLFVDAGATGANNGSSWDDAYVSLQDALDDAESNGADEIWVAAGVYYPDEGAGQTNDDRNSTFQLLDGVEIYGGFAATETLRSERDWERNVTVLSGDIDHETAPDITDPTGVITDPLGGIEGANAYTVVTGSGTGSDTVLDGFAITGGSSIDGDINDPLAGGMVDAEGSPTLANLLFSGNIGQVGAMTNVTNSNPSLTNVTVSHNFGLAGGMISFQSNPTLTDVTFSRNFGIIGAMLFLESEATLSDVTIIENEAATQSGGILNLIGTLTITNSRIISNSVLDEGGGGGIYNAGYLTITTSLIGEN